MYGNCIFCSGKLGSNDAIEGFPVGRTVAFDSAKGRLWAVCPKCSRWNLAPIEDRWEAVEEAERIFRDARRRVQRENIGLAKLRDGAHLVRIGDAVGAELPVWRYGRELRRRLLHAGLANGVLPIVSTAAFFFVSGLALPLWGWYDLYRDLDRYRVPDQVAYTVAARYSPTGYPIRFRWRDLKLVRIAVDDNGALALHALQARGHRASASAPLVLTGPAAAGLINVALLRINKSGAGRRGVESALLRLTAAGGAGVFIRHTAGRALGLEVPGLETGDMFGSSSRQAIRGAREQALRPVPLWSDSGLALALEIALQEEAERRALEGDLAELQAMWRQAEEIADIADRLPDLPPPDPPNLAGR